MLLRGNLNMFNPLFSYYLSKCPILSELLAFWSKHNAHTLLLSLSNTLYNAYSPYRNLWRFWSNHSCCSWWFSLARKDFDCCWNPKFDILGSHCNQSGFSGLPSRTYLLGFLMDSCLEMCIWPMLYLLNIFPFSNLLRWGKSFVTLQSIRSNVLIRTFQTNLWEF